MAHLEQKKYCLKIKEKYPDFFKNKKVLDIGSLDINGSNRDLFENCNYLGIDVGEGKNVDLIAVGHLFDGPDNHFDTIISTEVFEHDMFYEKTIMNIIRMLKPGGLFLFTCAAPGRPEHGTRRCGEDCAPLLIQISEEWADYYKNLDEHDIKKISGFTENFPDGQFEYSNILFDKSVDIYFSGIKGGEKYITKNVTPIYNKEEVRDHVFVVDAWPDTLDKENDLIQLIKRLKVYNITILLCGHFPIKPEIQNMVDYYIFDKNNPLLLNHEFDDYSVGSGRWTEYPDWRIDNAKEFHHDYAIWETMRNAFHFCKYLGKKYVHFLEYDNLPDEYQYRQAFIERINEFDAVIFQLFEHKIKNTHLNTFCATYIFSLKIDIALELVSKINSKREYFTNKPRGWNLEAVFYETLTKITNKIKVSDYIDNDGTLNKQAVWNREGITRNGAFFQIYLACDIDKNLYIHNISGFTTLPADRDYMIEVDYDGIQKFITIPKNDMTLDFIGTYQKGKRVKVNYLGVEVFNQYLGDDFNHFIQNNKLTNKKSNKIHNIKNLIINYNNGPFLEIQDEYPYERIFDVEFIDKKSNNLIFSTKLKNNWWSSASQKYFIDWKIKIKSDNFYFEQDLDLKNKRVLISFESKSLGDNLAWIPYVEKFRLEHNCHIICSTFFNSLFEKQYNNIEFVPPGSNIPSIDSIYRLGLFFNGNDYDFYKHPSDPKKLPLTKIASDILGLEYEELKPNLPNLATKKVKRVCIAIHSTAQCKYWNNPNGWQDVVDYLKSLDYEVRLLSREEDGYMGNKNPIGIFQQPKSSVDEILKVIQESELFIGISSGLSWLAWASGTPTILISGFTDDYLEPQKNIYRIINKNVCHGCWHTHKFDPGDWKWCPIHKGTNQEFICSKSITSEMVIEKIKSIL